MPCYHPLHGYHGKINPETGKRPWVSKLSKAGSLYAAALSIPCGRCIGCRLERSRQWAIRCVHEAQLHEESAFITLTYDDAHLPAGGTLIKKDFQDFAKRLRKTRPPSTIKYFHCGEYGELCRSCRRNRRECECPQFDRMPGRPHYHAVLFGVDFPDRQIFKERAGRDAIYSSEALSRLWPSGFCSTGDVSFESAAYVARYIVEKINGERAAKHYELVDLDTGEISQRLPEYTTMSLKNGGIAGNWYKQFKSDVYPRDEVVLRGRVMKPPKYYDRCLEAEDPAARAELKARREAAALLRESDNTTARLATREKVKLAQAKQLKRNLE